MSIKEIMLDAEAVLSEIVFGHGFLHNGDWPEGAPWVASAAALGHAQQACFDRRMKAFPAGVRSVLDVGPGTGASALALMCLFAASLHYVQLAAALRGIARYGQRGAVIFDYFRRAGASASAQATRGTRADFCARPNGGGSCAWSRIPI